MQLKRIGVYYFHQLRGKSLITYLLVRFNILRLKEQKEEDINNSANHIFS